MHKQKRNSYDAAFKLKAVMFAENSKNCAAAQHFEPWAFVTFDTATKVVLEL